MIKCGTCGGGVSGKCVVSGDEVYHDLDACLPADVLERRRQDRSNSVVEATITSPVKIKS